MPSYVKRLECPRYYNLKTTCHIHGWKNLAPFSWDSHTQSLHFAMLASDEPVDIVVKQEKSELVLEVTSQVKLKARQQALVNDAVIRALDLKTDTTELYKLALSINKNYAALVKKGAGRLLRAPSLWEDAAKTLFTTNCSWSLTKIMCESACSAHFSFATAKGAFPFPTADNVSRASLLKIKDKMRVGYRAAYIKKLAKQLSRDDVQKIESLSENDLRTYFSSIEGFGPYATNHMMLLCGCFSQIPVDSVVRSYLKAHHTTEDYSGFIQTHYAKWGRFQWWGLKLEQIALHDNWLGD